MMMFHLLLPLLVAGVSTSSKFPDPPIFAAPLTYPSICYLPPDSGLCSDSSRMESSELELVVRFYFDVTTSECYPFGVQKCGGNENRFKTRTECQKYCTPNSTE